MRLFLLLITITVASLCELGWGAPKKEEKTDRRGFFGKIKDAYIEGRLSANEKRVAQRKADEKLRRRQVFERNVKSLVDGISKRLRTRRSTVGIVVAGSFAMVFWLCHKGSIGCERNKTDK